MIGWRWPKHPGPSHAAALTRVSAYANNRRRSETDRRHVRSSDCCNPDEQVTCNVSNPDRAEIPSTLTRCAILGSFPHSLSPDDGRGLALRQNLGKNNQADARAILVSLSQSNIQKDASPARFESLRSHLHRLCLKTTLTYRRSRSQTAANLTNCYL